MWSLWTQLDDRIQTKHGRLTEGGDWEIGLRGLKDFRERVDELVESKNPVLREVAEMVAGRV